MSKCQLERAVVGDRVGIHGLMVVEGVRPDRESLLVWWDACAVRKRLLECVDGLGWVDVNGGGAAIW